MGNQHEVGIGDQVIVKHDPNDGSRDWANEPTGEVIEAADDHIWDAVTGEMSADFPWVVAFDAPQYLQDGTGPFTQGTVAGWRLELAPTADDSSTAGDAATEQDAAATH
jgi:hypothetical protein